MGSGCQATTNLRDLSNWLVDGEEAGGIGVRHGWYSMVGRLNSSFGYALAKKNLHMIHGDERELETRT